MMSGYCSKCGIDSDVLDDAALCDECYARWTPLLGGRIVKGPHSLGA